MTTIFTSTLTGSDNANQGYSSRVVLPITGGGLGQIRATFKASSNVASKGTFILNNVSIGVSTATVSTSDSGAYNTLATPVELLFSGGHGFSLTTNSQTIVSDWANLTGFTSARFLVVILDWAATGGGCATDATASHTMFFLAATASYNSATPSGSWTVASGNNHGVGLIEVQASGAAGIGIPRDSQLFIPNAGPARGLRQTQAFPPPAAPNADVSQVGIPLDTTIFIPGIGPTRGLRPTRAFPPPAVILPVPTMVQHTASTANPTGSTSETGNAYKFYLPNAVGAGNCLVLGITYPHGRTVTIADNNGNTWPASPTVSADAGVGALVASAFVLPNANAGVTATTITFNSACQNFKYTCTEYNNIDVSSPVNGTQSTANVSAPNLAVGSFTPTVNDSAGGNMIWAFFALANIPTNTNPTSWVPGGSFTLLDGDIAWVGRYGFPNASQQYLQTASAAINPSITATADSVNGYNCVAIALKVASAGTPIPSGIHVNKVIHFCTDLVPTGNYHLQIPATGNLRVLMSAYQPSGITIGGITDPTVWTEVNFDVDEPQLWYSPNRSADSALIATLNITNNADNRFAISYYDIQGAAVSPYDTGVGAPLTGTSSASFINNMPTITPSTTNGLVLAVMGDGTGPVTGLASGAPAGIFDVATYTGQTDNNLMDSGDGRAHFYNTNTSAINWNWTIFVANTSVFALAVAFKSVAGGGIALSAISSIRASSKQACALAIVPSARATASAPGRTAVSLASILAARGRAGVASRSAQSLTTSLTGVAKAAASGRSAVSLTLSPLATSGMRASSRLAIGALAIAAAARSSVVSAARGALTAGIAPIAIAGATKAMATMRLGSAGTSIALDGQGHNADPSAVSVSASLTTTNSNVVVIALITSNGNPITGVSSPNLGTFALRGVSTYRDIEEWYAIASAPLTAEVITATQTAVGYLILDVFGISGANTSSPFDGAIVTGSSDPLSISTAAANTFIFGGFRFGGTPPTSGAGWTQISGADYQLAEYQIVSSPQTGLSVTAGTGVGAADGAVADAVVAASAGAGIGIGSLVVSPVVLAVALAQARGAVTASVIGATAIAGAAKAMTTIRGVGNLAVSMSASSGVRAKGQIAASVAMVLAARASSILSGRVAAKFAIPFAAVGKAALISRSAVTLAISTVSVAGARTSNRILGTLVTILAARSQAAATGRATLAVAGQLVASGILRTATSARGAMSLVTAVATRGSLIRSGRVAAGLSIPFVAISKAAAVGRGAAVLTIAAASVAGARASSRLSGVLKTILVARSQAGMSGRAALSVAGQLVISGIIRAATSARGAMSLVTILAARSQAAATGRATAGLTIPFTAIGKAVANSRGAAKLTIAMVSVAGARASSRLSGALRLVLVARSRAGASGRIVLAIAGQLVVASGALKAAASASGAVTLTLVLSARGSARASGRSSAKAVLAVIGILRSGSRAFIRFLRASFGGTPVSACAEDRPFAIALATDEPFAIALATDEPFAASSADDSGNGC